MKSKMKKSHIFIFTITLMFVALMSFCYVDIPSNYTEVKESHTDTYIKEVSLEIPDYSKNMALSDHFSGTGSETSPYIIYNATDMSNLATAVNSGESVSNVYFKVANGVTSINLGDFTPIGNTTYPFMGHFDGNGANFILAINRSSPSYLGLFGYVRGAHAVVKNFSISGTIEGEGNGYAGSAVGYLYSGTVTNIYSTVDINSDGYVGGIVGYVQGIAAEHATVTNTFNMGRIYASGYVGGIVGYQWGSSSYKYSTISYSYSAGQVAGTSASYVGGVIGYYRATSGYRNNLYYDITTNVNYDKPVNQKPSSIQQTAYGITGLYTEDMILSSMSSNLGSAFTYVSISGTTGYYPQLAIFSNHSNSTIKTASTNSVDISIANGLGTENYPFLIRTNSDLERIKTKLVTYGETLQGFSYKVETKGSLFSLSNFVPIGTPEKPFYGSFDGNDAVFNLAISKSTTDYIGLFGYTGIGTIKNLSITGSVIGRSYVGGVSGYQLSGIIENVYNEATISAAGSFAGGIVGNLQTGRLDTAYNIGNITASTSYAGGIAGYVAGTSTAHATLTNTYNTGKIIADSYAGGLVGRQYDNRTYDWSTISYSYSRGVVSANSHAGGVVGYYTAGSGYRNYIYYDMSVIAMYEPDKSIKPDYITNEYGVYTDTLIGTATPMTNFSTGDWVFITKTSTVGFYPQLKQFSTSSISRISSHSLASVVIDISGGTGTADMPFLIETAADMDDLSHKVSIGNTYVGYYFQVKDGVTELDLGDFTAIGNTTYPFSGSFDGNGVNFKVAINQLASNYQGIFGYVRNKNAVVKNFSISGTIKGNAYVGSAVGYLYSGTVSNIYSTVDINAGNNNVGGIVGYVKGIAAEHAKVTNTFNMGRIYAYGYVGGIVGYQWASGSYKYSTISYSYSAGQVVGTSATYVGGVVGYYAANSGNRNNLYYDITQIVNDVAPATQKPSTEPVAAYGIYGLTSGQLVSDYVETRLIEGWTFEDASSSYGYYPQLTYFATYANSAITALSEASVKLFIGDGLGTEDIPFLIYDIDDLNAIKVSLNAGNTFKGFFFKVDDDTTSFDLGDFAPIGTPSKPFYGSFDGNDAVFNLAIDKSATDYIGLFGYTGIGTIKNLSITGSVIGRSYVGGVSGYQLSGIIENVYNEATISAAGSFAGGIVGNLQTGRLDTAYNIGNITASTSYAGGIAGYVAGTSTAHATLTNTYNTGKIIADSYAGGLVGRQYDNRTYDWSTISYSYSRGVVSANSYAGGVVGYYTAGSGYRNYIYYDMSVIAMYEPDKSIKPDYITNEYGVSTSILIGQDVPMTNFSETDWVFIEKTDETGYYPQLKQFSTSSISRISSHSLASVVIDISGGTGTADMPFLIETAADMDDLSHKVSIGNTYVGYYFQVKDGVTELDLGDFTAIGNTTYPFSGSFDGNGVNFKVAINRLASNYQGIFGYVRNKNAVVKNFSISGTIKGNAYVGSAVGYLYSGTVSNIYSTVDINAGNNNVGGIVGYVKGIAAEHAKVTNTFNMGRIYAYGYVGGIVGFQWASGSYKYSTISYSYSAGQVVGTSATYVGGVVGYYAANSGNRNNLYYDITQIVNDVAPATQKPSTEPVAAYGIYGLTSGQLIQDYMADKLVDGWTLKEKTEDYGYYPQLTYFATYDDEDGNIVSGLSETSVTINIAGGLGTEDIPFLIYDIDDLNAIKVSLNAGNTFKGFFFKVDDDTTSFDLGDFVPIGTPSKPFYGSFDGNDAVFNLAIDKSATDYIGLFGYTGIGTIKNLSITGSVIGRSYVGGVSGYQLSGIIENVYNLADIKALGSFAGGIVGNLQTGRLDTAYNIGNITASTSYAGGIAGYVAGTSTAHATLTNTYNTGKIIADSYAGGLVGRQYDNRTYDWSTISYSYSRGVVSANSYAGGVVGYYTAGSGYRNYIYYDMSVIAMYEPDKSIKPDYITNEYGVSTSILIGQDAPMTNFSETDWVFIEKTDETGYYPQLKQFSTSSISRISSHSLASVVIDISGGTGTADMPFLIETAADMDDLSHKVSIGNTYVGYYFQVKDGVTELDLGDFTAIGNTTYPFSGSFDGNGVNFKVAINQLASNYQGIFGYVRNKNAVVKNFSISGTIKGNAYVGSAVGYLYSGTVSNIYSTVDINAGNNNVGGIVGYVKGIAAEHAKVTNTFNMGRIYAYGYVGGIVGFQWASGSYKYSTISYSYSAGQVVGTSATYVGGVVGYYAANSGNRNNLYYDITQIVNDVAPATQKPSTEPVAAYGIYGLTSGQLIQDYMADKLVDGWTLKEKTEDYGYYPQLTYFATYDDEDGNIVSGLSETSVTINIAGGLGTEDIPFLIYDIDDLIELRTKVNAGTTYQGFFFKVDDDTTSFDLGDFVPIGTPSKPFYGSFDGNDAEFDLEINKSTTDYIGLFGYTGIGTIKNLSITGSVIGRSYVGGVSGYQLSGIIENVYNLADIKALGSFAGGIVGNLQTGRLDTVYNIGNITASTSYAGGIAGYVAGTSTAHATLTNAYNRGEIIAASYAGGLVGRQYNNRSYDWSTISYSYSAGLVSANSYAGGVIGYYTASSGYRVNIYYDVSPLIPYTPPKSIKPSIEVGGFAIAKTDMIASGMEDYGFGLIDWTFRDIEGNYAYYPQLKVFSESEVERVVNQSVLSVRTNPFMGNGTEESPFLIVSVGDMLNLTNSISSEFDATDTYYLVAEGSNYFELADTGFIPIGNKDIPFKGHFDGNYATFNISLEGEDYLGLFGALGEDSEVYRLGVTGMISGSNYIGAVAGDSDATIFEVYSTVILNGANYTGGIVGRNTGELSYAYQTNDVTGTSYVGGIAGRNDGTINNIYVGARIVGTANLGAIVGYQAGSIDNGYYDKTIIEYHEHVTSEKPTGAFGNTNDLIRVLGLDKTYMKGLDILGTGENQLQLSTDYWMEQDTSGLYDFYPQLKGFRNHLDSVIQQASQMSARTIRFATGNGSKTDPYIIRTAEDMKAISDISLLEDLYNIYFKVDDGIESIDLSAVELDYKPIGTTTHKFRGGLDGNYTNFILNLASGANYQGLFGVLGDGSEIRNLEISGTVIGGSYNGGIFGYADGAIIENVINHAEVSGLDNIGGIGGYAKNVVITNVYNTGDITNTRNNVGGIVAYAEATSIDTAYNSGDINGTYYVGGIVGHSVSDSNISKVYNRGSVVAKYTYVGGIVGYLDGSTLDQSYSASVVRGSDPAYTGGIVGRVNGITLETNSYYDETIIEADDATTSARPTTAISNKLEADDVKGVGKTSLTGSSKLSLDGSVWTFTNNDGVNAYYPQLTYFTSYDDNDVKQDSLLSVRSYIFVGEGIESSPYIIVDEQDMNLLSSLVNNGASFINTYFRVRKNINALDMGLTGLNFNPIGSQTHPFDGHFDGSGTNFIMDMNTNSDETGLFGYISENATITNLSVSGNITGLSYTGAIVGYNDGTISEVYSTASVIGQNYVGGIIGKNNGNVSLIYHHGYVQGEQYVGGIIGHNAGNLSNAFAVSQVYAQSDLGGVVGYETDAGYTSFAYYDKSLVDVYSKDGYAEPALAISNKLEGDYLRGLPKEIMTSGVLSETGVYFDDQTYWLTTAPRGFNLYYPQLAVFANNDNLDIQYQSVESIRTSRFTDGDGSEEHPYIIRTASDMKGLSDLILDKNTLLDTYFKVADDVTTIDLSDPELGYIAIGNASYPFSGNFDGNGCRFIVDVSVEAYYQGLFGYIGSQGVVHDLSVDGYVHASRFAGGVAGRSAGHIYNVYNLATVNASVYYAAGIVGYNEGFVDTTYNAGTISSGSGYSGGIVARQIRNTTVQNSYNVGLVGSNGSYNGGIIGYNDGNVYQTYNAGVIYGGYAGAIIGANTGNAVTTNSYYDKSKLIFSEVAGKATRAVGNQTDTDIVFGVNTTQLTGDDLYDISLDFDYFILKPNEGYTAYYPQLQVFNLSDIMRIKMESKDYVETSLFAGEGTEENPYYIIDRFDMKALSVLTQQGVSTDGIYFKVYEEGKEIDLSDEDLYYESIGKNPYPFEGIFLGNSAVINLGIENNLDNQGLFGTIAVNAIVQDLVLTGSIDVHSLVGSVAAINEGLITNVISNVDVNGADQVGGLVGINEGTIYGSGHKGLVSGHDSVGGISSENTGVIELSYHQGEIHSTGEMTGGLVGYNYSSGQILSSFSHGDIMAEYIYVGGLVGYNSAYIEMAHHQGDIRSAGNYVGGITAYNTGQIYDVYTAGAFYSTGSVAGIAVENTNIIQDAYYDLDLIEDSKAIAGYYKPTQAIFAISDIDGLKGLSHDEMTGTYSIGTYEHQMHFEMDLWLERDGYDFVTYYPEILAFMDLDNSVIVEDALFAVTSRKIEGEGTTEDPYIIYDEQDMLILKQFVELEHTFAGKYFKVADGVTLLDLSQNLGEAFTPIGTEQFHFGGSFDGQGVNILLNINQPLDEYVGLFHTLGSTAVIKNIEVSGQLVGQSYVGSVAGRNFGTVDNVTNYATVSSVDGNDIGGIVGFNEGTIRNATNFGTVSMNGTYAGGITGQNTGNVEYSYNHALVYGNTIIGGVVGRNFGTVRYTYNMANISADNVTGGIIGQNSSQLDHSFNHGNVTSTISTAGGLVGFMTDSARTEISYNTGNIYSQTRLAGGIVGHFEYGTIMDTYNGGGVQASSDLGTLVGQNIFGTISRSYYDLTILEYSEVSLIKPEKAIGNQENTSTVKGLFHGQMAGVNSIGTSSNQMNIYNSSQFTMTPSEDQWSFYPQLVGFKNSEDETVVTDSLESVRSLTFMVGSGTEANPFMIMNEADMIALAETTISGNDYQGSYFTVSPDVKVLDFTDTGVYQYIAIGDVDHPFNGHFDGQGTNFRVFINNNEDYQGLFGCIGPLGYVSGVSVSGAITGGNYTAGIAGSNLGTIENVYNQATIKGKDYTAGIVGIQQFDSTLKNAYNRGEITGYDYVGGIGGYVDGPASYTYNTGVIYGTGENIGALVGLLNRDLVTYSYYDTRILGAYNDYSNLLKPTVGVGNSFNSETVKGLDKGFMTGTSAIGTGSFNMNFMAESDAWTTTYNIDDNSFYPQLTSFSRSIDAEVKALSKESVQTLLHTITYDYRGATDDNDIVSTYVLDGYYFDTPVGFKFGYEFTGWYYEDEALNTYQYTDSSGASIRPFDLAEDVVMYATWKIAEHAVKFIDGDGRVIEQLVVTHGDYVNPPATTPEKSPSATKIYIFDAWDFDFSSRIIGDTIIEANYIELDRYYKVTYYNGDNEFFQEEKIEYGNPAIIPETDPRKTYVGDVAYKFIGWDFDFNTLITESTDIYPIFEDVDRYYTVRFFNAENQVISTQIVEYLGHAMLPEDKITKASTVSTTYTFIGFEDTYRVIESDVDVYPLFEEAVRVYTITFMDGNSAIFNTQEVPYGEAAAEPVGIPTKASQGDIAYKFTGWNLTYEAVESDMIIVAQFSEVPRWYDVTFYNGDGSVMSKEVIEYLHEALAPVEVPVKADTQSHTFVFNGWDQSFDQISSNTDIYPIFDESLRSYTVTFIDGNGDVFDTQEVLYGSDATEPTGIPTKAGVDLIAYKFTSWNDYTNITGDREVTANYTPVDRYYIVTFYNFDGSLVLSSVKVEYGFSAVAPEPPVRTYADNRYEYVFTGWSVPIDFVESSFSTYAQYELRLKTYTVTFVNGDETTTQEVQYGTSAVAPEPSKASTGQISYVFVNWDTDFSNVTQDLTVTAIFDEIYTYFTVNFYDGEGSLISTQQVVPGNTAVEPIDVPTKVQTLDKVYVFVGWDRVFADVNSNLDIHPLFTEVDRYYQVVFHNEDGTVISTQTIEYMDDAIEPITPTKEATEKFEYAFIGWSETYFGVTSDLDLYPVFSENIRFFDVTFVDGDGEVVDVQKIEYGRSAVSPSVEVTKTKTNDIYYIFSGWDQTFSSVKTDLTINAVFTEVDRWYDVIFYDGDGSVLSIQSIEYMQNALNPSETPVKAPTISIEYTFDGWLGNYEEVTTDLDIYPSFTESIRHYTVTFVDGDGQVVDTQSIAYEGSAVAPLEASKTNTDDIYYIFNGWSQAFDYITSDLTVNALFDEVQRWYTVRFFDEHNNVLSLQTIEYLQSALDPTPSVPFEVVDADHVYTITGWDKDYTYVTSDLDVYAIYDVIDRWYTVTFHEEDGTVIISDILEYGSSATAPADPVKPDDATYRYDFLGWDDEFSFITSNLDIYPIYDQIKLFYSVNFYHEDGTLISAQEVGYEQAAVAPADPTKPKTDTYRYIFIGWDKEFDYVTSDLNIYAQFEEVLYTQYTVTFYDGDGEVFDVQLVYYEEAAQTPDGIPTKTATQAVMYTFDGWDVAYDYITNHLDVHALFTEEARTYYVRFVDGEGHLLKDQYVTYGTAAIAPDNYSIPDSTDVYDYIPYWSRDFSSITEDIEVVLLFEEQLRVYTYTFYDEFGEVIKAVSAEYGTIVTPPIAPEKEMTEKYVYTFKGWTPEDDFFLDGNKDYYPNFEESLRQYTVTFIDGNGDFFAEIKVPYGGTGQVPVEIPTKESTVQYYYVFTFWQVEPINVKRDMTIPALFNRYLQEYKVTFIDEDGNILKQQMVEYGTGATEPEEELIPEKPSTNTYTYTFAGWSRPFGNVTEDMVVQTVYIGVLRTYVYTFYDYDQTTILKQVRATYGSPIIEPAVPTRPSTEYMNYEFVGWDKVVAETLTQDISYFAQYDEFGRTYVVVFMDGNNAVFEVQEVMYGRSAITPDTDPIKNPTTIHEFVFTGWVEDYSNITNNLEVHPNFDMQLRKYEVTFVTGQGEDTVVEVEYGMSAVGKIVTPYKPGYRFVQWDQDITHIVSDLTTNAVYAPNSYAVEFIADDADAGSMSQLIVEYDGTVVIPKNGYQRVGYYFSGWKENPDDQTVLYSDQESFTLTQEGMTLYADWIPIIYGISYELDGGEAVNPTQYTIEDEIMLQEAAKTDYKFVGWQVLEVIVNEDGSITTTYGTVEEGAMIAVIETGNIGNITLKAIYQYDGFIQLKDESTLGMYNGDIETTIPVFERENFDDENPVYLMGLFLGQTLGNLRENFINENIVFVDEDGNELTDDMVVATGYQIIIRDEVDETMVKDRVHIVLKGDTNGDGRITATDVNLFLNHINGSGQLVASRVFAAELTGDGRITATDVNSILNHVKGTSLLYDPTQESTLGGGA